jgi:hypothetical protein
MDLLIKLADYVPLSLRNVVEDPILERQSNQISI